MAQQLAQLEDGTPGARSATVGESFARALAGRRRDRLMALLSDDLDFEALTPRRHWAASSSHQAVDDIILRHWLRADDVVLELRSLTVGQVADRQRVGYRLAVRRDGIDQVLEQQAYYAADGQRISWVRILCSGYRPAETAIIHVPGDDRDQPQGASHA